MFLSKSMHAMLQTCRHSVHRGPAKKKCNIYATLACPLAKLGFWAGGPTLLHISHIHLASSI